MQATSRSIHITQSCPCNILQYFTAVKNDNFQMKMFDIFLIFAQNIDCRYTLTSNHNIYVLEQK